MVAIKSRRFLRLAVLLAAPAWASITGESRAQILRLDTVPKDGAGAAPGSVGRELVTTESKSERAVTQSLLTNAHEASNELQGWGEARRDETVSEIQAEGHSFNSEQKTARGEPGIQKLHASSSVRSAMTRSKDAADPWYTGEEIASVRAGTASSNSTTGEAGSASSTGPLTADAHMLRRIGRYGMAFRLTIQNTTGNVVNFPVVEVILPGGVEYVGLSRAPERTLTVIEDATVRNRLDIHLPYSLLPGELAEVTLQTRSNRIALDPRISVRAYRLEAK